MGRFRNSRNSLVNFSLLVTSIIIFFVQFCGVSPQRLPIPIPSGFFPTIRNLLAPDNRISRAPPTSQYTYRQTQVLNETQGFVVTWESFRNSSTITFNITAPLRGNASAIVFGLSKKGNVQGSDVVVISVGRSGQLSILDMHGVNNNTISIDNNQSWNITGGNSSRIGNGTISVTISRSFDTCDEQDILINNDMVHLIYGTVQGNVSNGTRTLPFTPDGSSREYLLDPIIPISTLRQNGTETFRISRRFRVPARKTSYWCTIHKGPTFQRKHHIIGFTPYFGDDRHRRHIHHQIAYRCIAPPTVDPALIFERYVNHPGEECYLEQRHRLPTIFCSEMVSNHGLGGEGFVFPENVGLALGETPNEYFMLESHYDNPEVRSDLIIETGVDFHYTSRVRAVDGSIMFIGTGVLGLHLVPPRSTEFPQVGQCSPECTAQMVPISGMHVYGAMLHAHTSTKKIRTKHYRGNREFPYITADNNYDFSFQQLRHVAPAQLILPGDRLVVECIMDTSSRNSTVVSGFSTQDEMCVTFLIVNKRPPYLYCLSEYPTERTMERFGIQNMTWDRKLQERVVNQARNESHVGRTLISVLNDYDWTPERREELKNQQNNGEHDAACPPVRRMAYIAYLSLFVQGVTGGVIRQFVSIDDTRPSTRTISTPKGILLDEFATTQMPREVMRYIPPEPCTEIIPPQRS